MVEYLGYLRVNLLLSSNFGEKELYEGITLYVSVWPVAWRSRSLWPHTCSVLPVSCWLNLPCDPIQGSAITLHVTMEWFSRWQWTIFFFLFSQKIGLTFLAKCLLIRRFAYKVKACFLGKTRTNISKCHLVIFF